ncbi:Uncharacterised protein [Vibrio cholerae]|nr:Uncharacterised protein [Vibrio cholerae]CSI73333.1 Uncharacterised protein [Vibrio cholerae]
MLSSKPSTDTEISDRFLEFNTIVQPIKIDFCL